MTVNLATTDDTYYIQLPDNIPNAAEVEARLAAQAAERDAQLAIEKRLCGVMAIPYEHCPWPAVRNELYQRILSGAPIEVYAWQSATVWMIDDRTYPDAHSDGMQPPRAWAIRNGFAVDGKESA